MTELRQAALAQQDERDWSLLEATQESLREHMAEIHRLRAALAQQAEPVEPVAVSVDALAQHIRFVDGNNNLGAGILAEKIVEFLIKLGIGKEQTEPVEPVAWMVYTLDGKSVCVTDNPDDFSGGRRALPLYTAPPQRPVEPVQEPVEPVATLTAQRDALLEACKAYDQWADKTICCDPELAAIRQQMRAAIKAVEEGK